MAFESLEDRTLLSSITVTSSLDNTDAGDGLTTLREAINQANSSPGLDTIEFDIAANDPGHVYYQDDGIAGQVSLGNVATTAALTDASIANIDPDYAHSWWTIQLTSWLPSIGNELIIDGYSQNGAAESTITIGSNAILRIEIDGSSAGGAPSIHSNAAGNTLRGLAINRFTAWTAIHFQSDRNTIEGNHIGTDISGMQKLGNLGHAMVIDGSFNTIGTDGDGVNDLGERNVISGNAWWGMAIGNDNSSQNVVAGNYIGTDRTGMKDFGNGDFGIAMGGTSNRIGTNGDGMSDLAERNVISGNGGNPGSAGILLHLGGANIVAGNYIGTNAAGTAGIGNGLGGIRIDSNSSGNWIGTNGDGIGDASEGNVISGNGQSGGIAMGSSDNVVAGNFIGTDATGTFAIGNAGSGIDNWSGGSNRFGTNGDGISDDIEGNVISGNGGHGLAIQSDNNIVAGNKVGTDISGLLRVGNFQAGIRLRAADGNRIGTNGDALSDIGERNIVSANGGNGIELFAESSTNVIMGNFVGTDVSGTRALGNLNAGIQVNRGAHNLIGTNGDNVSDIVERNVVSANAVFGVILNRTNNNKISGNFVGTDLTGTLPLGNERHGILISNDSFSNTIGTDGSGDAFNAAERNVISANGLHGIRITGATSTANIVAGNLIGTDVTGSNALGNGIHGIQVESSNNLIGTNGDGVADLEERNVISANLNSGISALADSNTIAGNFIGTDRSGTFPIANAVSGIVILSSGNLIGTNSDGTSDDFEGNVISGNGGDGIWIAGQINGGAGGVGNHVSGNRIGTDSSGTALIGNGLSGIWIDQASGNTIGTNEDGINDAAERNVISGNAQHGIVIDGSDWDADGVSGASFNAIAGNYIGTDLTGAAALGNGITGITVYLADDNRIGSDLDGQFDAAEANLIAFNTTTGVTIAGPSSIGNSIQANSIHSNGTIGIDLNGDGVTSNDPGDIDLGPNSLQNYPVLTNVVLGATTRVVGTFESRVNEQFTIDVYANSTLNASGNPEGERYLGSFFVTTDATGHVTFDEVLNAPTNPGKFLTLIATDSFGNTSEFLPLFNRDPIISSTQSSLVVDEGQIATNTGSFSDPDEDAVVLTSSVGTVIDDGNGTWSWSWQTSDGIDDSQLVTITATDSKGAVSTTDFMLDVLNVAPTANDDTYAAAVFTLLVVDDAAGTTTAGNATDDGVLVNDTDPAGPVNDPLLVTTTGTIITAAGATVTMNSDGTFTYDATTSGTLLSLAEGLTFDDTFSYDITDGDGGVDTATVTVTVTGADDNSVHVIDCFCGGGKALVVRGSSLDDKIDVKFGSMAGEFKVTIKSGSMAGSMDMGSFKFEGDDATINKVIVYGLEGNDDIKVHSDLGVNAWLFGGEGDDKLRGGKGHDVLVGAGGDDKLDGKDGRDILIGGLGADKLNGDKDEDILIAAATAYDSNLAALCGIQQEWTKLDADGQGNGEDEQDAIARAEIIRDSYFAGGLLGGAGFTVDDGEEDELKGGSGSDWFLAQNGEDKIKDDNEDIFGLDNDWFDLD